MILAEDLTAWVGARKESKRGEPKSPVFTGDDREAILRTVETMIETARREERDRLRIVRKEAA